MKSRIILMAMLLAVTFLYRGDSYWYYNLNHNNSVKGFHINTIYKYNEYHKVKKWHKTKTISSKFFKGKYNYVLDKVEGYDDLKSLYIDIKDNRDYRYLLDNVSDLLLDIIKYSNNPYEARYAVKDLVNLYHYKATDSYYDIMFNHNDPLVRMIFFKKLINNKFLPDSIITHMYNKWLIYNKDKVLYKIKHNSKDLYGYKSFKYLKDNISSGNHLLKDKESDRFYLLHIPEKTKKKFPLIVTMHGQFAGDSAYKEFHLYLSQIKKQEFVLLSPDVHSCYLNTENVNDDISFVMSLIRQLEKFGIIDISNIAIYGFSSGTGKAKLLFNKYAEQYKYYKKREIKGRFNFLGLYYDKLISQKRKPYTFKFLDVYYNKLRSKIRQSYSFQNAHKPYYKESFLFIEDYLSD